MNSKLIRNLTLLLLALLALFFGGLKYLKLRSSRELARIEQLSHDLQTLRVGSSTYQEARAIAERYGTAKYVNDWGTRDCADGYFERCAYRILIKTPAAARKPSLKPWLQRLGLPVWSGNAHIFIDNGKVDEYSFSLIFKTRDEQWRGFGTEEYKSLPERAVAAEVSTSYLVSRNDIMITDDPNGLGYSLDSTLTPQSTKSEIGRAWHYEFSCLAKGKGCNEICDVLPDAWNDFYINRGRLDVQKFGSRYAFCTKSDLPK